jgi:hypothetical protein
MRYLAPLALLLASTSLPAATLHVDIANPQAADSNNGSAKQPFKSIQHAADVARPGDVISVGRGEYPEYVTLKNAGTEKERITFQSATPRAATLNGFAVKTQYITIDGFHLTRDVEKNPKSKSGIDLANADHVLIENNLIENSGAAITGGRILASEPSNHVPTDIHILHNKIYHSQYCIIAAGKDWLVEGNDLERLFAYNPRGDCDYTRAFGNNIEFRYNFFHGTKHDEIAKAHVDIVQFFDNNSEYLDGLHIHHNVFTDFHQGLMGEMNKQSGASNLTFDHNIYYTADPWGAWGICNKEIPNVHVVNNTFYGIQWFGVGIMGQKATGGLIQNNIFQKIEQAIQITADKRKNETKIDSNILFEISHKNEHGPTDKVDVNPKMTDPAHGDFRLAKDSPAIHAGADNQTIGALDYPNTYVVDPNHPAATDDGFGYPGQPFKTINKALSVAQPGETILLRPATYTETFQPKTKDVTLMAEQENTVTLPKGANTEGLTLKNITVPK